MNTSVRSRPTLRLSARVSWLIESVSTGAPRPSPMFVSTVLRSGRSGMNHDNRNATATTAVATRNTTWSASVKAEM